MTDDIIEASYKGNIGAIEMMKLFKNASDKEMMKIDKVINKEDWEGYKKLVKKILGVNLK